MVVLEAFVTQLLLLEDRGKKNHVHLSAPLNIEYLNIELSIFCAHEAELCLNMKRDKIHCETHLSRVY